MSHKISLQKAMELTANYEKNKKEILKPEYAGTNILPVSETFDKAEVLELLNEPGCKKMRLYFGMDENKDVRLIIVGVDDKDQNLVPRTENSEYILLEFGQRCPPICPGNGLI